MRLRIYKRKVVALLLALGAAACALALWGGAGEAGPGGGGGGSRREESPLTAAPGLPGDQPPTAGSTSRLRAGLGPPPLPPANGRPANSSSSSSPPAWPSWPEAAASLGPNGTLLQHYRALVYRLNFDQPLRGAQFWPAEGEAPGPLPVALVVQVHERAAHLRQLLASLRRAAAASPGPLLLVLSHDVWSPELNALAAAVDFCAALQVFFPFSRQLYPREFPGSDPRDCPRDLGAAAARQRGCLNARFPDSFGHYREAAFAQAKHHWWWKLHFAWERVRALRQHRGPVLFLEEDHYLAPDALHLLRRLWALRAHHCPDCQVLSLGSYAGTRGGKAGPRQDDGQAAFAGRADQVELKTWKSTEHNMGLAFGRDTYRELLACTDAFCTYDDYNWDWTLQHLTVACLPRTWKVLLPEVPRVFHTGGDCGMHHRRGSSKEDGEASCPPPARRTSQIDALLDANRQHLFPPTLAIGKRHPIAPIRPHVKNGGWGDIRDHELCKSYRRLQ